MIGRTLLVLTTLSLLGGCATLRTLDAAKPGAPIVYSGTRLDWYSLNGGCCPVERFGAEAPKPSRAGPAGQRRRGYPVAAFRPGDGAGREPGRQRWSLTVGPRKGAMF